MYKIGQNFSKYTGVLVPSINNWAKSKEANFRKAQVGNKNKMESFNATIKIVKIQEEYMEKISEATSDFERTAIENEMADKS